MLLGCVARNMYSSTDKLVSRIVSGPCKLFIGQIRGDIGEGKLLELFSALPHTGVRAIYTYGRMSGALVTFDNTEDADAAILSLHGSTHPEWVHVGRCLQVSYSKYSICISLLGCVHAKKLHLAVSHSNPTPHLLWPLGERALVVWH